MSRIQLVILGVAAAIIIGSAGVHGVMTDRWVAQHSEKLTGYSARIADVPTEFGDWTSQAEEIPPDEFKASGCDAYFSRGFVNSVTGDVISVFLVSGRGYHVTIHTPQFCYKAAGFNQAKDQVAYEFEAPGMPEKHEVVHALFKKDTPQETQHLRILWTYTVDGTWRSPKLAKYTYGREPAMYKMYLVRSVLKGVPEIGDDPAVDFAKEFLPLLNQALFPSSDDSEEVGAIPAAEVDG